MTFIIIFIVKSLIMITNLTMIGTVIDFNHYNTQDFYNLVIPMAKPPP
jgi:hypothetical protein